MMFGGAKTTFGSPASSAFGQATSTLFGATSKPVSNVFGQPSSAGLGTAGSTSIFGSGVQSNTFTWGGTSTAVTGTAAGGTSVAFNPPITPDTVQRSGQQTQVNAKHMCITAMKEYQDKSLEELRLEDYALNRQSGGAAATSVAGTSSSLFSTSTGVKPFQFSATQTTNTTSSIFGQANKPANTFFGGSNLAFGGTSATTQPAFGQGAQTQANSLFGAKPLFGASGSGTGLFGAPQTSVATASSTGFTFGQPQATATGLGTGTNLFGQPATGSTVAKPNLFGSQPASGSVLPFGSNTTNLFGAPKTTGTTSLFGAPASGLAGAQPQQTGFGFGGLKPAGTTGLFGTTTTSAVSKPGGIFGIGAATITSCFLLNTTRSFLSGSATGFGFGTGLATGQTSGFGGFGSTGATTNVGLFGQSTTNPLAAKKTFGFGSPLTNSTSTATPSVFGFGQTATGQTGLGTGGGLFGAGATNAPATGLSLGFGSGATGSGTLFGQTATGFGQFGQKPGGLAPTGFGLGGGSGLGGTGSFFGAASTGLASLTSSAQPFGSAFGTLGTVQSGQIGGTLTGLAGSTAEQMAQNVRAQQHVLELVRSMPYGQSPLYRYINMPSGSEPPSVDESNKSGTLIATNTAAPGSVVVPARAAATALAERHKVAGLTLGSGSPGPLGLSIIGTGANRNVWLRRPGVTQRLLQVSNRGKLFSGFYEDDAFLSPTGPNSSAVRLRRSATFNTDSSLSDSLAVGPKAGSFFLKRDEWKRLHLPDSVRSSILERSAASASELSHLAEASINETHGNQVPERDPQVIVDQTKRSQAAGDGTASLSDLSRPSTAVVSSTVPTTLVRPLAPSLPSFGRTGVGMTQAREALRSEEDSVLLDDLETTWTAPGDQTVISELISPDCKRAFGSPKSPSSLKQMKGIKLTKPGYYTLPTLSELSTMVDSDGSCIVEDFVVGRRHYGHILFPGNTNVTDLDLDSIVYIRRREVVVYPDDEKKPPVGFGLNKRAEICLESVWPTDKATREPIKSPERLSVMRFEERLERATRRMDARFIEYRPESGSWVFEVKHFSKYRLDDSDDDNEKEPIEPKVQTPKTADSSVSDMKLPTSTTKTNEVDTTSSEMVILFNQHSNFRTRMPHLKAVSDLINETDSDMQFSPSEISLMGLKHKGGMKTIGFTNSPISATYMDDKSDTQSAVIKQMREAFFSPASTLKPVKGRSALFFQSGCNDQDDEAALLEAAADEADYHLDWFGTGTKRMSSPSVTNRFHIDQAITFTSPSSRWIDDNNDDASLLPVTPFRPIPFDNYSEGVPLSDRRVPPLTANLHLARIPIELKFVNGTFKTNDTQLEADLYPYEFLSKLCKGKVGKKHITKCTTLQLSRLILDAGLSHGHGMRPSWGQVRTTDLHAMALVTTGLSVSRHSTDKPLNLPVSVFPVCVRQWPSLIEQADESGISIKRPFAAIDVDFGDTDCDILYLLFVDSIPRTTGHDLLNVALRTSACQAQDQLAGSSPQTLSPPTDHCPLWQPNSGLVPLEVYGQMLQCDFPDCFTVPQAEYRNARMCVLRRLISLCLALWGRHPQETIAEALVDMANTTGPIRCDDGPACDNEDEIDTDVCLSDLEVSKVELKSTHSQSTRTEVENVSVDRVCSPPAGHSWPAALLTLARKQAVSEWIRSQSYSWLEARLKSLGLLDVCKPTKVESGQTTICGTLKGVAIDVVAEGIFACLVAGEPGAACRLALAASLPGLVSLIAQSSSSDRFVRGGLQRQLTVWHEMKYDQHFPLIVLRIYALLAGLAQFPHPKQPHRFVSVLEQLDWIRVFGAYVWYLTDYGTDLSGVLHAYSQAWHSADDPHNHLALAPPVPPRQSNLVSPSVQSTIPASDFPLPTDDLSTRRSWPRDCAYHLIQLFCKRTHSLERTLEPCSISQQRSGTENTCLADPSSLLDWAPSWTLWRVLHALGYRHFLSHETPDRICTEFSAQLEDRGLWEWAVFVLLHLSNQQTRDASVKATVARHASLVLPKRTVDPNARSIDQLDDFLISLSLVPHPPLTKAERFVVKLGVPARWIHEAKAVLARHRFATCNQPSDFNELNATGQVASPSRTNRTHSQKLLFALLEAAHWFAAGHFGSAHQVCLNHLLPDIVLHTSLSFVCATATSAEPTFGVARLGHRLSSLLSPFRSLSPSQMPDNFATGVGVYLKYSEILLLTEQLAHLCQQPVQSALGDESRMEISAVSLTQMQEVETQAQLIDVISDLQKNLDIFTEQLQRMPTPTVSTKVVRTEMAATCAQLTSAFLSVSLSAADSDTRSAVLDRLQRQLTSIAKLKLPADHCLKELSLLSEVELSMGLV
ncbi:nuclear pore complex protein Nup98-Nup96 [Paragonimus westermani]|uniref:Nuclear pore complex protein Nup98-Nup96 n=1 Tax=Paragonimus westermani TaxID=34504 RepID=A0A5J4NX61_9TREM|nr:nuclear pore complex protein Nup98-Nup96 [Paragonimus westermani]